ncbi:hypothetical protein [Methyloprofundus sp.]|uniref:hypothetical protein n=1 Tax=Methyloprofundus sp. TaxID=2020875 RepID=UPI003D095ABC
MKTNEWYAWINLMPPKPDDFHVVGEVVVGNPGIEVHLCAKEPQGINPKILLLNIHLVQKPGVWPDVLTSVQARFDKILTPTSTRYDQVEVFLDNESIAQIPVEQVH